MGSWLHGFETNDIYQFWNAITSNNKPRLKFNQYHSNAYFLMPSCITLEYLNTGALAFHIVRNLSIFTYGDPYQQQAAAASGAGKLL